MDKCSCCGIIHGVHTRTIGCHPYPISLCAICWGKLIENLIISKIISYDRVMSEVWSMKG